MSLRSHCHPKLRKIVKITAVSRSFIHEIAAAAAERAINQPLMRHPKPPSFALAQPLVARRELARFRRHRALCTRLHGTTQYATATPHRWDPNQPGNHVAIRRNCDGANWFRLDDFAI